jgi:hypothetical protein
MPTRRQFLVSSSAVCALSALPKSLRGQQQAVFTNASIGAYEQGLMTLSNFQTLIGSMFMAILADGSPAYLTLASAKAVTMPTATTPTVGVAAPTGPTIGVKAMVAQPSAAQAAPLLTTANSFQLVFLSGTAVLPQGSYLVDHATLGRFAVFLVPGTTATGAATVSANFNYLSATRLTSHPIPVSPVGASSRQVQSTVTIAPVAPAPVIAAPVAPRAVISGPDIRLDLLAVPD